MKEYIERAQLLKNLGYDEKRRADVLPGSTFDIVLKEPAADVAEVRHGEWKYYHKQNKAVCTNCSFERDLDTDFGRAVACPNCGARMDKEANHEVSE